MRVSDPEPCSIANRPGLLGIDPVIVPRGLPGDRAISQRLVAVNAPGVIEIPNHCDCKFKFLSINCRAPLAISRVDRAAEQSDDGSRMTLTAQDQLAALSG